MVCRKCETQVGPLDDTAAVTVTGLKISAPNLDGTGTTSGSYQTTLKAEAPVY